MAQITTGFRAILSQAWAYDAFQSLLGAGRSRRRICADHLKLAPGDVIVDVGCGTASIIDYLPQGVRYFGLDLSAEYIENATRRYGSRGTFACKDVATLEAGEIPPCQAALAIGLLHHLDDAEARALLAALYERLAPGGKLVTVDPAYWSPQPRLARWLISRDRGRNVRTGEEYRQLVPETFREIRLVRRDDLLNIPYTHAVLECSK